MIMEMISIIGGIVCLMFMTYTGGDKLSLIHI